MANIDDTDDESTDDENIDNQPSVANSKLPVAPPAANTVDPTQLFNSAQQNLNQAQTNGVTKEQLNALTQHQGSNAMVNMFMNMVGAAGRVNPAPFQAVGNEKVQQEAQRLALQHQLSQQSLSQAGAAEQLGTSALSAQQKQVQLQAAQAPLSTLQKATLLSLAKQSGIKPPSEDDLNNMNQMQYQNALGGAEKAAQFGVQQQHNASMLQMYQGRNIIPVTTTAGQKILVNKATGEERQIGSGLNNQNVQQQNDEFVNYFQLQHLAPAQAKQVSALQKDYQKNWAQKDLGFQQTLGTLSSSLDQAQKGNYVASGSLPAQEARLFEGLSGRLTNFDIQMMNDPANKGIVNSLQSKIQGVLGEGKVTPQDAQNIKALVGELQAAHEKNMQRVQGQYSNRATSIIGKPFKDDNFMFGGQAVQQNPQSDFKPTANMPVNHISLDDYAAQKQQGGQ